jgi:hypothetical protein
MSRPVANHLGNKNSEMLAMAAGLAKIYDGLLI